MVFNIGDRVKVCTNNSVGEFLSNLIGEVIGVDDANWATMPYKVKFENIGIFWLKFEDIEKFTEEKSPKFKVCDKIKTYDGYITTILKINKNDEFEYVYRDKYGELCWSCESSLENV